jgi:murein L,D-transpeptidase YcbB/YkuD
VDRPSEQGAAIVAASRRKFLQAAAGVALGLAVSTPAFAQPGGAGLEGAVRAAARGDQEVARFYEQRGYRPLWVRGGMVGPEARQLLQLIETAGADGLVPRTYRPHVLVEALDEADRGSPKALARAEVLLSTTFANYVRDVRRHRDMGVVTPKPISSRSSRPRPPCWQAQRRPRASSNIWRRSGG